MAINYNYAFGALMLLVGWQNNIWPVKNLCLKTHWDGALHVKSLVLSCEVAYDKYDWRLKVKGATGYPRSTWKVARG